MTLYARRHSTNGLFDRALRKRAISRLASFRPVVLLLFYSTLTSGCYDRDDERMYPYRFEIGWSFGGKAGIADLNYDGGDEIVYRVPNVIGDTNERWLISESDGSVIDQINLPGKVLHSPSVADVDGDSQDLEVLFGVNRTDSLFLYAFKRDGTPAGDPIFITSGKKRIDPNGTTYDWEAEARFFMIDINNDQKRELVTIVASTYAGLPRGVFVNDITTGRHLGSKLLGAPILDPVYTEDLDQDGSIEMVFASGIPNHGAEAGGLNDREGYLLVVELAENPILEWWDPVDIPSTLFQAYSGSFNDKRGSELVTITIQGRSKKGVYSRLRSYDLGRPLEVQTPVVVSVPGYLVSSAVGDLDGDGIEEVYTLGTQGDITRFERFRSVRSLRYAGARSISTLADVTGDGLPDITLQFNSDKSYLLNRDLEIVAYSQFAISDMTFRSKSGQRHLLTGAGESLSMVPNQYYLLSRYGDEGGIGLVLTMLIVAFVFALKRVRVRSLEELLQLDFGVVSSPVFRMDSRNGATPLNESAVEFGNPLDKLTDLRACYSNGTGLPDKPETILAHLKGEDPVTCIVFPVGSSSHLLFLIRTGSAFSAEGWRRMTSRVAHDIRNPLTSILLTVQRLQAESEALGPDAQVAMQPLLGRIEDRIDHLRRKSRQIMKVAGTADETPSAVRINEVLERIVESTRGGIPGDIDIIERMGEDLPPVMFDPDLLESVLENVIMNAVQAMPTGGRLMITSERLENYRVNEVDEAGLYVCVSIADTGTGIEPRELERVFDPGFSSKEEHSGLGLTLVKRIIEQHNGHIRVSSEVGSGTEFAICLVANET